MFYYTGGHWTSIAPGTTTDVLTVLSSSSIGWTSGSAVAQDWSQFPATQDVDFDGFKGINVLDPTSAQDIVTKAYADSIIGGAPLGAFYVTTQANSTLTNEVNLGLLTTGIVLSTVSSGVSTVSILPTTDFVVVTGAQTIADVKTFTSPPVMSGASITTGTIPFLAVAGTAMDLTTSQTAAGVKTFSSNPKFETGATVSYIPTCTNVDGSWTWQTPEGEQPATLQTTDATPSALISYSTTSNSLVTISGTISAPNSAYTGGIGGRFEASLLNTAGTLSLLGTPVIEQFGTLSTQTFNVITSGTNIVVQVTGVAATTINWKAEYNVVVN